MLATLKSLLKHIQEQLRLININSYLSYLGLGSIYLAKKDFAVAKQYYQKALFVKPDLQKARSALDYLNSLTK